MPNFRLWFLLVGDPGHTNLPRCQLGLAEHKTSHQCSLSLCRESCERNTSSLGHVPYQCMNRRNLKEHLVLTLSYNATALAFLLLFHATCLPLNPTSWHMFLLIQSLFGSDQSLNGRYETALLKRKPMRNFSFEKKVPVYLQTSLCLHGQCSIPLLHHSQILMHPGLCQTFNQLQRRRVATASSHQSHHFVHSSL